MLTKGVSAADIAAYTIEFIRRTLAKMSENLRLAYPDIPIVYAGGVMSCQLIRFDFEKRFGAYFASPAFSADNAAGVALLGYQAVLREQLHEC